MSHFGLAAKRDITSSAAQEQLLDLRVADPVVLLTIQHRQQHIQMAQQIAEADLAAEADREVGALAPLGELLVESVARGRDLVAERLEQPPQ
jgi:hypothetical protein